MQTSSLFSTQPPPPYGLAPAPFASYKNFPQPPYRDYQTGQWQWHNVQPNFPPSSTAINNGVSTTSQNSTHLPTSSHGGGHHHNPHIASNSVSGATTTMCYIDTKISSSAGVPPPLPELRLRGNADLIVQIPGDKDKDDKDSSCGDQGGGQGGEQPFGNASAAFLGPQLWEKTIPSDLWDESIPADSDFKLEYMDLDEILDNDIDEELIRRNLLPKEALGGAVPQGLAGLVVGGGPLPTAQRGFVGESPPLGTPQINGLTALSPLSSSMNPESPHTPDSSSDDKSFVSSVFSSSSPSRCQMMSRHRKGSGMNGDLDSVVAGGGGHAAFSELLTATLPGEDFDPRTRSFSEDELKPQPLIKKSRKQVSHKYVLPEMKDDRYWARRRKNNMAAKRSRDARRTKENQIALRANFLEKENQNLRIELDKTRSILETVKKRLCAYETA